MRVVLLAGGRGTRLAEETDVRPKPMVEIGGRPILWHVMSIYASHGHRDFVVACGYKGEIVKAYFHDLWLHEGDVEIDLRHGARRLDAGGGRDWRITLVDTGIETETAGRILRLRERIGDEPFLLTYGDGLADVDLGALVRFHRAHGRVATVTAVHPPARFGALELEGDRVARFSEKLPLDSGWINGGFFVFEPRVFEHLSEGEALERGPLERLAAAGELMAFRHEGFWQPMDTLREKRSLEALWASGTAPWKVWA